MKKHTIVVLIIIVLISSIGFVLADNPETSANPKDIQTISKNGISIKFPSDWGIARTTSNHTLIAIAKLSSIDSNGVAEVNINIEKTPFKGSFEKFVNETYAKMEKLGDYNLTSFGAVAIGDLQGLEYNYKSDINGTVREHRAIWLEKNSEAYVILYSAPIDQFNGNLNIFDFLVRNFQIN